MLNEMSRDKMDEETNEEQGLQIIIWKTRGENSSLIAVEERECEGHR